MDFRSKYLLPVIAVLFLCVACKKDESPPVSGTASPSAGQSGASSQTPSPSSTNMVATGTAKTDACALLTSAEIESVQREAVKETKLSGSKESGFSVSRCFFTLPTFTNSISLQITQRGDGPDARDPKTFWSDTFHREYKSEKEKARAERKEEEEGESSQPMKVNDVGDEAFWMGTRVGGALYVLKGNNYLRVSISGSGAEKDKINRSKALAQNVAARL